MNLSQFFEHWKITENPFRGEEARHDEVFTRLAIGAGDGSRPTAVHSDFEKIVGDIARPSTAVVFGEKGSGKTAIKLQMEDLVARHNADEANSENRVFYIPYDDMNRFLDRLHEVAGGKTPLESFKKTKLTDHLDAVLALAVTRLTDSSLGTAGREVKQSMGGTTGKRARALTRPLKRDLLLLQALYDISADAHERTTDLRRKLGLGRPKGVMLSKAGAAMGWLLPVGVLAAAAYLAGGVDIPRIWQYVFLGALGLYGLLLLKRLAWDRLRMRSASHRVGRRLRILDRPESSWAASLEQTDPIHRKGALPDTGSDELRYAMLGRLRRVLDAMGYRGVLVIIDRVDEPTLVSGDADRMRAITWPLFNNKFLQQEGLGVKMLLPVELRFALFKESGAFFQEARLDKQNMVERLSWTGAMLYDLCDARLQACLAQSAEPITLLDLFAEDVTRQDLVDALNEMHQPRDAFKFVYRCLTEHCSNVTKDQNEMRIPRLVVEHVRKAESDRVQQLYRGIRPA